MSYIYKITNNINDKVYIGKTNFPLEKRFKEHLHDAFTKSKEQRPLYNAIRKYGAEHFAIELIEECPTTQAPERESYWIGYYKGYEEGYNATKGGDGKLLFNHEDIAADLRLTKNLKETAEKFGCSKDLVYYISKEYDIKYTVSNSGYVNVNFPKKIKQKNLCGEDIQIFDSIQKAAEWLLENNYLTIINSGVRSHIAEAANKKRKTAYQFQWEYIDK